MAKIAVELEQALARRALNGTPGNPTARTLAQGEGWTVEDVICTSGPQDRPYEERHASVRIVIIAAGSFQYRAQSRSGPGRELMTPGSLLLGNAGQCFECGHEHGSGDRCLSFGYAPEHFERLASDAGLRGPKAHFHALRLPPLLPLSPLVARACSALARSSMDTLVSEPWEEISLQMAVRAVELAGGAWRNTNPPPSAEARVTRVVRTIERQIEAGLGQFDTSLTLENLAREARLSPYHFLRTFERLTGVTPHRYVLRRRLREAAMRLAMEPARVLDIAFDCGFGDVSNFNRAFRTEFGVSPRVYRNSAS